ncbi:MAG: hypothetical protein HY512_01320 [Candidatus Aenigmarchaeota archaeon]|nr:hypothetical protein [Candidatus Aenigmarchaeota archaeon]
MVYSVLFVQKTLRLDCRINRLLDQYRDRFDVTIVAPENPIPEDGYRKSDAVVAHLNPSRVVELRGLHRRHPETNLLLIPLGLPGDLHRELKIDGDGAYFLPEGFTETDFVDSIARLSERRRTSLQSPVY